MDKDCDKLVVHRGYVVPRYGSGTIKTEDGSISVEQFSLFNWVTVTERARLHKSN
jgi:hypothetical protein